MEDDFTDSNCFNALVIAYVQAVGALGCICFSCSWIPSNLLPGTIAPWGLIIGSATSFRFLRFGWVYLLKIRLGWTGQQESEDLYILPQQLLAVYKGKNVLPTSIFTSDSFQWTGTFTNFLGLSPSFSAYALEWTNGPEPGYIRRR
jgi:hypothetical protein